MSADTLILDTTSNLRLCDLTFMILREKGENTQMPNSTSLRNHTQYTTKSHNFGQLENTGTHCLLRRHCSSCEETGHTTEKIRQHLIDSERVAASFPTTKTIPVNFPKNKSAEVRSINSPISLTSTANLCQSLFKK